MSENIEHRVALLSSKDPRHRLRGVQRLANLASQTNAKEKENTVNLVGNLWNDKEAFVRWNVAIALGKTDH